MYKLVVVTQSNRRYVSYVCRTTDVIPLTCVITMEKGMEYICNCRKIVD